METRAKDIYLASNNAEDFRGLPYLHVPAGYAQFYTFQLFNRAHFFALNNIETLQDLNDWYNSFPRKKIKNIGITTVESEIKKFL